MTTSGSAIVGEAPSRCPVTRLKRWLGQWFDLGSRDGAGSKAGQGRCPLGFDTPKESVFVEKAAREAAETQVVCGDAEAGRLLAETRAAIYHWPKDFKGFACRLRILAGGDEWRGSLRAGGSRNYELAVPSFPHQPWLRFQIEEFLAHREHPTVSRMASPTGVVFGDDDSVYGRRIDFLGDKMGSWYRIRDRKLTMIGRSYARQRFVITIDAHEECSPGRYASTYYTAYYWNLESEKLNRVEAFMDDYIRLGGESLPARRRYVETTDSGMVSRSVEFLDHELL